MNHGPLRARYNKLMGHFAVAGILAAFCSISAAGAPMTRLERQRVVAHLAMTGSWLADEVSGLSPAQLHFRPAPGNWSILEVLDHLVLTGPLYWQELRKALEAPPRAGKRSGTDDAVLWYGIDRTVRQKAWSGEGLAGEVRDLKTGLEAFGKLHARLLEYAGATTDDLRGHVVDREQCDAYQWLLLISTHTQRHILQIREIKKNPKFPGR